MHSPPPPAARPRLTRRALGLTLLGLLSGCALPPAGPVATDIDPDRASPDFWWDQPVVVRVPAADFDRAVAAAEQVLRQRFFDIDLTDARRGLVLSKPNTAAQFFEIWRWDNSTAGDVARSSLGTYRRTVRFDIRPAEDNRFVIEPRVLIEQQARVGRRVTAVVGFRGFTTIDQSSLVAITEEGAQAPPTYWYAIGRDHNLEIALGNALVNALY